MKTTIELPDDLLAKAKSVAAMRHTTLRAMIEHALRREIGESGPSGEGVIWEKNEYGFPVLKRRGAGVRSLVKIFTE